MSGEFLPPAAHIRRRPVVILDVRAAEWLSQETNLADVFAARAREADRGVVSQLAAVLACAGLAPDSAAASVDGTSGSESGGVGAQSSGSSQTAPVRVLSWLPAPSNDSPLTTSEMARRLGVTDRAVRAACRQGRISGARRLGRSWVVDRLDFAAYEESRTA